MSIDLNVIINWAIENWILLAAIVGGIILLFVILAIVAGNMNLSFHKDFPTDGPEANRLALGLPQLLNSGQYWNDPTASMVASSKSQRKMLQDMWGLHSEQDVLDNIERLVTVRRRRDLWQQLLEIRGKAAAANGGGRPTPKQWLAAIQGAGGSGKGEERDFVNAVHYYEDEFAKITDKTMFGKNAPVITNFDGYSFGQAVAVATWGVGMGFITRERSAEIIRQINDIARPEFASWADFGRSYAIGKVMHWSEGRMDEKAASKFDDGARSMETALEAKNLGPWASLPWQL